MKWLFLFLALASVRYHIYTNQHMSIVRHDNFVVAATDDGYVCYGTFEPRHADCHKAIEYPVPEELVEEK